MRKFLFLFFAGSAVSFSCFSQGGNLSGIINTYAKVTELDYCLNTVSIDSPSAFSAGNKVLLIQMKGVTMDSTNTASFGSVINYNQCGNYEFLIVESVTGNTVKFMYRMLRNYDPEGLVQLIKFPSLVNTTISDTLTCAPWNGNTGGVLVLEAGSVIMNAPADVSGKGLRGGSFTNSSFSCNWAINNSAYSYTMTSGRGAQKGEGIMEYDSLRAAGKGPLVNGGGGGNDHNTGGGGGGNGATGGSGGERITTSAFLCQGKHPGNGGRILSYSNSSSKIFMGGGGGAGHGNNSVGTDGARGGGIIILKIKALEGNNHLILANGKNQEVTGQGDGAGGGGGGGTILFHVDSLLSPVTLSAKGGNGGSNGGVVNDCAGPGGGGGGGVIWTNKNVLPGSVVVQLGGGSFGKNNTCDSAFKSIQPGDSGIVITELIIPESILPLNFAEAGKDTSICPGDSVPLLATGGINYSWTPSAGLSCTSCPNPSASPNNTTTYFVTVTDSSGCTSTDSVIVNIMICAGIQKKNTTKNIVIYPNPGKGEFTIQDLPSGPIKITIVNEEGKSILDKKYSKGNEKIYFKLFIPGLYFITIETKEEIITKKVTITP